MEQLTLVNMGHLVKRAGHKEEFDERKLLASINASCLVANMPKEKAMLTAKQVVNEVNEWLNKKSTLVNSNDIRHQAGEVLKKYDHEAAYSYIHHRVIW